MKETDIMEEISKSYLEVIANRSGYFNSIHRDYGTDLTIRKAKLCPVRRRYLTTGKAIDIQVKAVTETYVRHYNDTTKNYIKYDLEQKNYNDLVDRANENGSVIPLLLAIFILPSDKLQWVDLKQEELVLRKCAFWYKIPFNSVHSTNSTSVTIEIPKTNKISMEFYDEQFLTLD